MTSPLSKDPIELYRAQLAGIREMIRDGLKTGLSIEEIVQGLTEKNLKAPYMNAEKALRLLFLCIADEVANSDA